MRTRGRAILGALAIVLISASMPAGAGVIPDELDFVDEVYDIYDEENRDTNRPGRGVGWAIADMDIADINLTNLVNRGSVKADTGDIRTSVDTYLAPKAELNFNPYEDFNEYVPPWNPQKNGLNSSAEQGSYRTVIKHPEIPDVEGLLGFGRYYVRSNRMGSYAELGSASGWMRAERFGLVSDMGDKGLASSVNHERARAKAGVTIEDFQINLNDIFQQKRVELPLGLTLDIATAVSLPGGEVAQKAYERLKKFEQELGVLNALASDLETVQAELEPYVASMPGYAEARALLEQTESQLVQAKAEAKAKAEAQMAALAENEQLNAAIAATNNILAGVTADIAMLQGHIDGLQAEIEAKKAEIEALRLSQQPGGGGGGGVGVNLPGPGIVSVGELTPVRPRRVGERVRFGASARVRAQTVLADPARQLADAIARLETLTADLASAQTGKALMEAARQDLTLELDELQADKAVSDALLATANVELADAQETLESITISHDGARQAIEDAERNAGNLEGTAGRLVELATSKKVDIAATAESVLTLLEDLAAMLSIYEGLTDTLQPWPLFKISAITYELDTLVNDATTEVKIRCGLEGVYLLGETLPINTCDDLRGARPMIEDALEDFLESITVQRPEVTLTVPEGMATPVPRADGFKQVQTKLSPLGLTVTPVQLADFSDPLMDEINRRIDMLQEQVSYDEIRDIVRPMDPPVPSIDWDLGWDRGQEWRVPSEMQAGEPGSRSPVMHTASADEPRYRAAVSGDDQADDAENDLDEKLDGFQQDSSQTAGNTAADTGTSGVDTRVGGMSTDVLWAGCVGCNPPPPPCEPGDPDCPEPCEPGDPDCPQPCEPGDPDCPEPCEPGDPDCPEPCQPGDPDCINPCAPGDPDCTKQPCKAGDPNCVVECEPGVPCRIGDPCLPGTPGCVNGRWGGIGRVGDTLKGGKGTAGDGAALDDGAGAGAGGGVGNGSDGVPVANVVGDANLPHTGGRPATLLLGLGLLLLAGLTRRKSQPAAE